MPKWSEFERGETVSQEIKLPGEDRKTKSINELQLDEKWVGSVTTWVSKRLLETKHNLVNRGWVVSKKFILKSPNKIKLVRHGGFTYVHKAVRI